MQEHSAVFLIILMCEDIIANRREKFNKTEFLYATFRADMTVYDTGDQTEKAG